MRRIAGGLAILLAMLSARAVAQTGTGWVLTTEGSFFTFKGGSEETATNFQLRPHDRLAPSVALLIRRARSEYALRIGYHPGHVRADADALSVDDKTFDLDRIQAAATIGRRIARTTSTELFLVAAPTLDLWKAGGSDVQAGIGGEVGLSLRIPLGRGLELDNHVVAAVSGTPFTQASLPTGVERKALFSYGIGAGVRIKL